MQKFLPTDYSPSFPAWSTWTKALGTQTSPLANFLQGSWYFAFCRCRKGVLTVWPGIICLHIFTTWLSPHPWWVTLRLYIQTPWLGWWLMAICQMLFPSITVPGKASDVPAAVRHDPRAFLLLYRFSPRHVRYTQGALSKQVSCGQQYAIPLKPPGLPACSLEGISNVWQDLQPQN